MGPGEWAVWSTGERGRGGANGFIWSGVPQSSREGGMNPGRASSLTPLPGLSPSSQPTVLGGLFCMGGRGRWVFTTLKLEPALALSEPVNQQGAEEDRRTGRGTLCLRVFLLLPPPAPRAAGSGVGIPALTVPPLEGTSRACTRPADRTRSPSLTPHPQEPRARSAVASDPRLGRPPRLGLGSEGFLPACS